jgi:quercetin dioxygenase-like cupin family protein
MAFIDWSKIPPHQVLPGVRLRTPHGEKIMLSMVELDAGAIVPWHSHPHEQAGLMLEGELDFTIGEQSRRCRPGESFIIPGNTPHTVKAITACRVLDIFSPPREDYMAMGNKYIPERNYPANSGTSTC